MALRSLRRGAFSCKEIVPDIGRGAQRDAKAVSLSPSASTLKPGLAAAACGRADFPNEIDQLLLCGGSELTLQRRSRDARLRNELDAKAAELRQARDNLEMKVAERTADLRRSEALLGGVATESEPHRQFRLERLQRADLLVRRDVSNS